MTRRGEEIFFTVFKLVSFAAVFSVVTQRDDTKNGREGDYLQVWFGINLSTLISNILNHEFVFQRV